MNGNPRKSGSATLQNIALGLEHCNDKNQVHMVPTEVRYWYKLVIMGNTICSYQRIKRGALQNYLFC